MTARILRRDLGRCRSHIVSSPFPDMLRTHALVLAVSALVIGGAHGALPAWAHDTGRELAVCADPDNLPFSNAKLEGFDNRLAELIAHDLDARVRYVWWAPRRGSVRHALTGGLCDVALGVPVGWDPVLTTKPYYRSTYVFVSRHDRGLQPGSLDDPSLRRLRI